MRCGRTYQLKPGSGTVYWDGGRITLSRKVVLKNGRLMVPVELVDVLKSHQTARARAPVKKAPTPKKPAGKK